MDPNPYLRTKYAPPPKPAQAPESPPDPHAGRLVQDPEIRRLREEDLARDEALDPFSERGKRRLTMYVVGSVIFFPLVTWFFTPAGFQSLWFQWIVSVAFGSFVALKRPTGVTAVLATLAAGLLVQAFTGHVAVGFGLLMSLTIYGFVGALVGFGEMSRIIDGR